MSLKSGSLRGRESVMISGTYPSFRWVLESVTVENCLLRDLSLSGLRPAEMPLEIMISIGDAEYSFVPIKKTVTSRSFHWSLRNQALSSILLIQRPNLWNRSRNLLIHTEKFSLFRLEVFFRTWETILQILERGGSLCTTISLKDT